MLQRWWRTLISSLHPTFINFKLCTLMHSVHNNRCPTYVSDVVQSTKTASTRGGLRSAESTDYVLPRLRTEFAERSFSRAGPATWNRLPEWTRRTSSQAAFKRQLKTFLFSEAFNILLWFVVMLSSFTNAVMHAPMVCISVMGAL